LEVDFLIRPHQGWAPQRNARHVRKMGAQNATQGTSASWAPQRNARHVRKLGAPTHVRNARHVRTSASWAPQRNTRHVRNARHVRKLGDPTHVRNARHVRNLGAPTQRKARPQDGRPNATLIRNENVHTREH
jgi:hypothetical protein